MLRLLAPVPAEQNDDLISRARPRRQFGELPLDIVVRGAEVGAEFFGRFFGKLGDIFGPNFIALDQSRAEQLDIVGRAIEREGRMVVVFGAADRKQPA